MELEMHMLSGKMIIIPATARETQQKVNGHLIKEFKLVGELAQVLTPAVNVSTPPAQEIPKDNTPKSLDLKGVKGANEVRKIILGFSTISEVENYVKGDERKSIVKAAKEKIAELS